MPKQNKAKFRSFTKRLQCMLSAMLMLLMTFTTVPIEAFAENDEITIEKYGIWIQEVRVTSENASDILGNGVFSYDAKKQELTVKGNYDSASNWSIIDNRSVEGLKIHVASNSCLTKTLAESSAVCISADTTITGTGMLTVESDHAAFEIRNDATLTFSEAKIKAIEKSSDACPAIFGNSGYLVVDYSDLSISCSEGYDHKAIGGFYEQITLTDCDIVTPEEGIVQDGTIVDSAGNPVTNIEIKADAKPYGLWVSEVPVTRSNASNILGNGVFSYDAEKKILTVKGNYDSASNRSIIDNRKIEGLEIYVASDSCLTKTLAGSSAVCISADTTITGPGKLTVESDHMAFEVTSYSMLTITDAKISAIEKSSDACPAIYCDPSGSLIVDCSDLSISCSEGYDHKAISFPEDAITIKDSDIVAPERARIEDRTIVTSFGKPATQVEIRAYTELYALRVAGVRVTDKNASDILENGVFSYNDNTKILTVKGDYYYSGVSGLIQTIGTDEKDNRLMIYVAEDSHLTMNAGWGAFDLGRDTTIAGPGTLTLESNKVAIYAHDNMTLTIKDTTVNIIDNSTDPLNAMQFDRGNLAVISSDLNITGCDGSKQTAIGGYENTITLEDCSIVTPQNGYVGEKSSDGEKTFQTIINPDGNAADNIEIKSGPRSVEYSVIPNSKAIRKDCYNDPDYSAGINGKLKFSAAGNERESGQIIINSNKRINNITFDISDLKDKDNNIISSNNIEVSFEYYVYEPDKKNWNITDTRGWHSDALMPRDLAEELGMNRLETACGNNQGIWFTLNVPSEQAKGTYYGEIKIYYDGVSISVPVEVTVYNFDLPDQTYNMTRFNSFSRGRKNIYQNISGIQDEVDYANAVNSFINIRKISTGYTGIDFEKIYNSKHKDNFRKYADSVYEHVTKSKCPYYNIDFDFSSIIKTTEFNGFNYDLFTDDKDHSKEEVIQAIDSKKAEIINKFVKIKGSALSDKEKEAVKFAVKYLYFELLYYMKALPNDDNVNDKTIYNSEEFKIQTYTSAKKNLPSNEDAWKQRLYDGIMLSGEKEALDLVKEFYGFNRYTQYDSKGSGSDNIYLGIEGALELLVDKSFETNTDLLKYAYFRPKTDEPQIIDYWANIEALLDYKTFEDSKKGVKQYIIDHYKDHAMCTQIIDSLENICFLITISPTEKDIFEYKNGNFHKPDAPMYSSMLYKGLGFLGQEDFTDYYQTVVYPKGYANYTGKVGEKQAYSLTVEKGFTVKSFCPLFNDFSEEDDCAYPAKNAAAANEARNDPNIHLWWYSCMSHGNPLLAGYNLGGNNYDPALNGGNYKSVKINGNYLAIARINKWQQFKLGIEGELLWAADDFRIIGTTDPKYDMWESTDRYCNDGKLIYPVYSLLRHTLGKSEEEAEKVCQNYGYFTSSMRLENLSEGCDDYDYLCIANDLIKKAALAGESKENIAYWTNYINGLYDTMFDDVNYDENANSENLRIARDKLAKLIENLQTKTRKAVVYEVIPGDCDKIDIKFACNKDGGYLSDFIHLDFTDCTASIGTLTKKGNVYEYVLPVVDLPTTTEPISDLKEIYPAYFKIDGNNNITTDNSSISFVRKDTVDLVTPLRSSGYTVNRFWNKPFDESYSDWKTSGKAITFEIKATPLNCEKIKDNEDNIKTKSSIYFNQASPWRGTTKPIDLDPVEGTYNGIKGEQLDHGWYRITIPFSSLEEQSSDVAKNTIDMIEATWINKSFAIRNISISDAAAQPPTEIRPVKRTVWGDANCDDRVDLSDAILIMQSIANPNKYGLGGTAKTAITAKGKLQADVDTSVKGVTGNDAVMIQKYLLKIIKSLEPSK